MKKFLFLSLLFIGSIAFSQSGYISTIAGTGTSGYTGDGSAASAATLSYPQAVVFDSDTNMYIADAANHVIRKVTTAGVISTYAGVGIAGYNGDGLVKTNTRFHSPYGLAVDTSDNIYVADLGNHRIRKITASTGLVSTVAGTGVYGYSGDSALAVNAKLYAPSSIAFDTAYHNLIIADSRNNRIRSVDMSTGIIYTIAGTGVAGYSGNGSAATSAKLNFPIGVAVDSINGIFIADKMNNQVRKILDSTGVISAFAGTGSEGYSGNSGSATSAKLCHPTGVMLKANSATVYIADQGNQQVRKVVSGTITSYAGEATGHGTNTGGYSGDGAAATAAKLNLPSGIAFDPSGNAYISDSKNNVVRKVNK